MTIASTLTGTVILALCLLLIAGGAALLFLARSLDDDTGNEIPPPELPLDLTGWRK